MENQEPQQPNGGSRAVATRDTIHSGSRAAGIVPANFDDAWRIAKMLSLTGMVPKDYRGKPEDCCAAVLYGLEIGLAPMVALQSIAVINGRPSLYGDSIPALLWSRGFKLRESISGEGDARTATCTVVRPEGEEITRTFSVADAKKANLWNKEGPWRSYPDRMQMFRARGFAARDGAADVLRGLALVEEQRDIELSQGEYREVAPRQVRAVVEVPDIEPVQVEAPAAPAEEPFADPKTYLAHLDESMAACIGADEVQEVWDCNAEIIDARLSRTDRAGAEEIRDRHIVRVNSEPAPAAE